MVCVALLALETSHVVGQRNEIMARARGETANLATSLAQHAELTFRTADVLLIGTVARLQRESELVVRDRPRLRSWFLQEVRQSAQFVGFAVIGSDGSMIVSSADSEAASSFSDHDYFAYHRDHDDRQLVIGKPFRDHATGRWVIPATRRFNRADGGFGGVAVAALDPEYFQKFYDGLRLGNSGAVLLASLDGGRLLVRRPFAEANIGRDMSQSGIFQQLKRSPFGSVEITASTDGVTRLNSYEQGKDYRFVVAVAQDVDELLAPWRDNAVRQLGIAAIVVAFVALMGAAVWRITRVLSRGARAARETSIRFDAALSNMTQGISMFDSKRRLVVWNARFAEIYRLPPALLKVGTSQGEIVSCIVGQGISQNRVTESQAGGEDSDSGDTDQAPPGDDDTQTESAIAELADGRSILMIRQDLADGGWLTTHEDITERIAREKELSHRAAELARTNMRFDAALRNMSHGLSMFDRERRLVIWNDRYVEIYGLAPPVLKAGVHVNDVMVDLVARGILKSESGPSAVQQKIEQMDGLAMNAQRVEELTDGRLILITRQPTADGGWVATHQDITEQRRSEAEITHLARHDPLTGLANRAEFNARLNEASKRLRRSGSAVTVMMLDLDKFKAVNDTLGHPAGDRLLIEVAQRLKAAVRETDVLARLGGDEFAIIQESGVDQHEGAIALALRIIHTISQPFDLNGHQAVVGTSIGIAMAPEHGTVPEDLLKKADLALYDVKANGRNDFRIFQARMLEEARTQQSTEARLRDAIEAEEFELNYQTVVDASTRLPCGVEALVRWRHPTEGLIGPEQFIPLAEKTDLIVPLGEWIIQQACKDAATWPDHIKVAINISAVQFSKANLFDVILCALVETGLAPDRLELEITEATLLKNQEANLTTIRQLKNLGISMVLDDFGTGVSSVNYLSAFPFDKIKIDRSFTQGAIARRECRAVVASTLALARELGTLTTAEGVETEEQFEYMRAAGVKLMQGYLFARPVPADQLELSGAAPRKERVA